MLSVCLVFSVMLQSLAFDSQFTFTHTNSHIIMFFTPSTRNSIASSMIKNLEVNPSTNQVLVTYSNSKKYLYTDVSEDAIFDVLFNNVKSFGQWVNQYCKQEDVSFFAIAD